MARALSIRRPLLLGLFALAALLGGLGTWSATAPIAGAIIAPASIAVEGNHRAIQHPEGGVLEAVFVAEGDRVEAGAVLFRFDGRLLRAERAVVAAQLTELAARKARLEAERDGAQAMASPAPSADRVAHDAQRRLFEARRAGLLGQTGQLKERILQIEAEIAGTLSRRVALETERALVAGDAEGQERLLQQGLTEIGRVTALRRDIARIDGDLGELSARTARLRAEVAETRLAILALEDDRRERAISELSDLAAAESELTERARSLDGTLALLEVRAPVAGTVLGLRYGGPGAVVRPAEVMLDLVPGAPPLVIAARIAATDIDAVRPGQGARLRFAAFDMRTTPEVPAHVVRVSPDVIVDEATGVAFYTAELRPDPGALDTLGGLALVPGMPVDAFLLTGERTALAYILGPFTDYFSRAFREG